MSNAQHVKKTFQQEWKGKIDDDYNYRDVKKQRMIDFRAQKLAIVDLDKPTNIPRARELGYKAKEGISIARVRIRKGSGMHPRPNKARRPKRMGVNKLTRRTSINAMAERRVGKKYPNMEVLNSYKVGADGTHHYYEVILVDPYNPAIKKDRDLKWICEKQHKGRAERGLTSAGTKSRGLSKKGHTTNKSRPSQRANKRKAN